MTDDDFRAFRSLSRQRRRAILRQQEKAYKRASRHHGNQDIYTYWRDRAVRPDQEVAAPPTDIVAGMRELFRQLTGRGNETAV